MDEHERRQSCLHIERIVVLETQVKTLLSTHDDILHNISEIKSQLTRYHGFLGGIAFLVSGVAIMWNLLGDWIKAHWQ